MLFWAETKLISCGTFKVTCETEAFGGKSKVMSQPIHIYTFTCWKNSAQQSQVQGLPLSEESADTHTRHDHIHRGQYKSEIGPDVALESVSRGVRHCVAQHLENAAELSAKLPGRPILRPVRGRFAL